MEGAWNAGCITRAKLYEVAETWQRRHAGTPSTGTSTAQPDPPVFHHKCAASSLLRAAVGPGDYHVLHHFLIPSVLTPVSREDAGARRPTRLKTWRSLCREETGTLRTSPADARSLSVFDGETDRI